VQGRFGAAFQTSLDQKRNAAVVQDGISAEDIATLPAQNLGEALQSVPGVQLDREGERREAGISLRGLPGGMVRTTANGQSIASPTRSNKIFGAPGPFGAYEAAVFSGVNVEKSATAKTQEGGIAGSVDLQLPNALSQKNGATVALGARLEELADKTDTELKLRGTYHFIEDVLAGSANLAYSDQNFRTDTIRTTRYNDLEAGRYRQNAWQQEAGVSGGVDTNLATYEEWTAANNIADGATVLIPTELRQGSEINGGSRLSFSGNLGYQANEQLTLGATVLFTENDMDDNRYEQLEIRMRDRDQISLTPVGTPINTGQVEEDGSAIWAANNIQFHDADYYYDNRQYNFLRASQAVIFDAEWQGNNITVDGAITISDAENEWDEILISPRTDRRMPRFEGAGLDDQGSDVYGQWNTGSGNVDDYLVDVFNFDQAIDFDNWVWGSRDTVTSSGAIPTLFTDAAQTPPGGVRDILLITGTYERLDHDLNSLEVNVEKAFDNSTTTIEAGFRFSEEQTSAARQRVSGAGIDLTDPNNQIFTNAGRTAADANDDFFGGNASGYADITDGWYSFDFNRVNEAMLATLPAPGTLPNGSGETDLRLPNGYVARAGQLNSGLVYETEVETTAAYIQTNFDGELGDVAYRGNFGMRYVSDDQSSAAPFYQPNADGIQEIVSQDRGENKYDYLLPSINLAFDLTEDVVLRLAHSESISRPNLRQASPQTRVNFADGSVVGITLPGTNVQPFESDNLDISLEWYNREGSSIALAYFNKKIDGFYRQGQRGCSLPTSNIDFGNLFVDGDGVCRSDGNDQFADEVIREDAQLNIVQWFNADETITIEGFEFAAQQNLSFLPYPWNGFGGIFNYTQVSQRAEEPTSDDAPIFIEGVSDSSYNVIAYYEQDSWGLRFAYNWRNDYDVQTTNTLFGLGVRTVKAVGRLDMSAYYDITDNFTLSLKGYNLNESLYEEFQDVEVLPRRQDFEGRTVALTGVYKF